MSEGLLPHPQPEGTCHAVVTGILTGKTSGKTPLRRPRWRTILDNRMDHKEIGVNMRNGIDSVQD